MGEIRVKMRTDLHDRCEGGRAEFDDGIDEPVADKGD
jgi:hypothetical protein